MKLIWPHSLARSAARAVVLCATVLATGCVSLIDPTLGVNVCSSIPGIVDSSAARYSPDGTKIVFHSKRALDGTQSGIATFSNNIWIMNADGSSKTALTRNTLAARDSINPRFSPDGLTIVFESKISLSTPSTWDASGNASSNIFKISADGTGLTALTANTLPGLDSHTPVFEPVAGTKIAFVSRTDTGGAWDTATSASLNLFEMNSDGTGLTALTLNTNPYLDTRSPEYAPDALTLVVSTLSSTGGVANTLDTYSSNIATIPSGGGALTFWTTNTSPYLDSREPVFFPDATGSQIAYSSYRDVAGATNVFGTQSANIWLTNTIGPVHTALTTNTLVGLDSFSPAFSPDQITIAFHSKMDITGVMDGTASYSHNIFTVPVATGAVVPLTLNTIVDSSSMHPVFDPTSVTLLYQSLQALDGSVNGTATLSLNLWTLPAATGTPQTALTNHSESCVSL